MIRLEAVGHVHAARSPWSYRALENIDLTIETRERVAIVGGNGAGKSTLASILAGVLQPSEGRATLDGVDLADAVDRIALVVQAARLQLLLPTVSEELGHITGKGAEGAARALAAVGAPELRHRRVDELSGGQQRLVAVSGALARRPALIVLDEPLAGVDAETRRLLLRALGYARSTVVVVTHDLPALDGVIDRVVTLDAGRIAA